MTSRMRQPSQLRIGDAERESAVTALGEHYAAGRISADELDSRTSAAYAARTEAELWPLFADLPPLPLPQHGRPSVSDSRRSSRSWPALGPVLLVVLALVVLTHLPWPLLLLVGWIWWARTFRHWSRSHSSGNHTSGSHTSGSRRDVRGTWS
jgi:hypothetical protein